MQGLGRLLKNRLTDALSGKPWEVNPLKVIGLSHIILTLGLSNDQLYELCRKMARDLFIQFHEDRLKKATPEQRMLSDAFNLLKDREIFERALDEFRDLRSDLSAETLLLRESIQVKNRQVVELEAKVAERDRQLRALHEKGDGVFRTFGEYLRVAGTHVSVNKGVAALASPAKLGIQACRRVEECKRLVYARLTIEVGGEVTMPAAEELVRKEHQRQIKIAGRKRLPESVKGSLRALARNLGALNASAAALITQAKRRREPFPAVTWEETEAFEKLGMFGFNGQGKRKKGERKNPPIAQRRSPGYRAELSREYRRALDSIKGLLGPGLGTVTGLDIGAREARVSGGFVEDMRIVGCMRVQDLDPAALRAYEETGSDLADYFSRLGRKFIVLPERVVLSRLVPFLFRGGVIIAESSHRVWISSENPEAQWHGIYGSINSPKRANYFILGVVLDL